jgi:hypothetical protein
MYTLKSKKEKSYKHVKTRKKKSNTNKKEKMKSMYQRHDATDPVLYGLPPALSPSQLHPQLLRLLRVGSGAHTSLRVLCVMCYILLIMIKLYIIHHKINV